MCDPRLSHRRTLFLMMSLLIGVVGVLVSSTLFRPLVAPLVMSEPLHRVDALVVFGGGLALDGQLGASTRERVLFAGELYRRALAEYVIVSGGYRVAPSFEEAAGMANLLTRLGVPRERIFLDRRARNTFENARHVYELCLVRGFTQVILVTSPYHMRRALGCLRRYPLSVLPAPVGESEVFEHGLEARLRAIDLVVHEYGGLISYWWRGWL